MKVMILEQSKKVVFKRGGDGFQWIRIYAISLFLWIVMGH